MEYTSVKGIRPSGPSFAGADPDTTVITLGPEGTDAHHVACRFQDVVLVDSFPEAMACAWRQDVAALICAGYVDRDADGVVDSWVSLHFRYTGRMEMVGSWAEPTKPMCVAVNTRRVGPGGEARSVALHPSTEAFAERYLPHAERIYAPAKPLAVGIAAAGRADACIGSLDIAGRDPGLRVVHTFQPSMLWCLYRRVADDGRSRVS
ncbi:hypothetical protein OK074_1780 [Actinobacteria bacterium OK074]|nr:hypothetical protein OK074_1780 [Actinobacteria bacterium OK074]